MRFTFVAQGTIDTDNPQEAQAIIHDALAGVITNRPISVMFEKTDEVCAFRDMMGNCSEGNIELLVPGSRIYACPMHKGQATRAVGAQNLDTVRGVFPRHGSAKSRKS